jgi:GST-like protein
MIDFYTANTPNGKKVAIMLEELQVPYTTHMVDLKSNEQKKPEFIAMNPNGRIPTIVDNHGPYDHKTTVFESGAILYYLSEKMGGQFFGHSLNEKAEVMEWLMFQMSGIGPILGNYYYGIKSLTPPNPGFIERFEKEAKRLVSVMEIRLHKHEYLACDRYTIADIATYPWVSAFAMSEPSWFADAPGVQRWIKRIAERPAVIKVMQ